MPELSSSELADASVVLVRVPQAEELQRVRYVMRDTPLPEKANALVAVKQHPLPHLIGALAWWQEASTEVRFRLQVQPGAEFGAVAHGLLAGLESAAHQVKVSTLRPADVLAAQHPLAQVLLARGYEFVHTVRIFRAPLPAARERVARLFKAAEHRIPQEWRVTGLRGQSLATLLEMVQRHRLMPADEFVRRCQPGSPGAFEPDLSSVLWAGDQLAGAFLVHREGQDLTVDVRVVELGNLRQTALGNLLLLQHCNDALGPDAGFRDFIFRGGEQEHKETANLAFRIGGIELEPTYLYRKRQEIHAL